MIRLQTNVRVAGLSGLEVTEFMLNCEDASYQAWWPGVHLQFHTVRRVAGDVGNLVYMDEYVGRFRLKFHAIVTAVALCDPALRRLLGKLAFADGRVLPQLGLERKRLHVSICPAVTTSPSWTRISLILPDVRAAMSIATASMRPFPLAIPAGNSL